MFIAIRMVKNIWDYRGIRIDLRMTLGILPERQYANDAPMELGLVNIRTFAPIGAKTRHIRLGEVSAMTLSLGQTVHMSPLWGFGVFGVSAFYKHIAPLGLNTDNFRHPS